MRGNAMEEGLMLQINNPSHTDPARISALLAFLVWIFSFLLMNFDSSFSGTYIRTVIAEIIALAAFAILYRHLTRNIVARKAAEMEEYRRMLNSDTERKLAEARANGDFDRFAGASGK